MVIPKGLVINLMFLVILIFIYIYLEDKTDLFQFNSKRNIVSMQNVIIKSKYNILSEKLQSFEKIVNLNSPKTVDNIIDGIFHLFKKKDTKKKFVKIISRYQGW